MALLFVQQLAALVRLRQQEVLVVTVIQEPEMQEGAAAEQPVLLE